jgi:hypothetical protein
VALPAQKGSQLAGACDRRTGDDGSRSGRVHFGVKFKLVRFRLPAAIGELYHHGDGNGRIAVADG